MTSVEVTKAMMLKSNAKDAEAKTDGSLLKAYVRGDVHAFDELYSRYKQPLYNFLRKNCFSESLANELFQDVWLGVVSSSARYVEKGRFRSWLFSMAHNRLVDQYKHAARRQHEEYIDSAAGSGVEEQVTNLQQKDMLQKAIGTLSLEQRSALLLREDAGLSLKDIAHIQGITLEAAKSRLRYAYGKLRDAIAGIEI